MTHDHPGYLLKRVAGAGIDIKRMEDETSKFGGGIHKQHPKFLPLRYEHTRSHGHCHGGAGNGDVPVRGRVHYRRDSHSCNEVGQEEGQAIRIVCAHPHSWLTVLSK